MVEVEDQKIESAVLDGLIKEFYYINEYFLFSLGVDVKGVLACTKMLQFLPVLYPGIRF
jgi:hypothetical protein